MAIEMTPVTIIAMLFAIVSLVKIIIVIADRKWWYKRVSEPIYGSPTVSAVIFTAVGAVILYLLLQELSIVQIFASILFGGILTGLGFLLYSRDLMLTIKKIYRKSFSVWMWLYLLVWIVLLLWVLYWIFLV